MIEVIVAVVAVVVVTGQWRRWQWKWQVKRPITFPIYSNKPRKALVRSDKAAYTS